MNVLSFVSLARIDASTFTIVAQLKVLSTGFFSYLILSKQFNKVKIVALFNLVCGAILVTTPSISNDGDAENDKSGGGKFIGVCAVALEVMLSGFASIYFEKVIKGAGLKSGQPLLGIFERNVQVRLKTITDDEDKSPRNKYYTHSKPIPHACLDCLSWRCIVCRFISS